MQLNYTYVKPFLRETFILYLSSVPLKMGVLYDQ